MKATAGYFDFDRAKMYYEVAGEGAAVLFIHGGCMDSRMWDVQVPVFTAGHRMVRIDMFGHGKSDYPLRADAFFERYPAFLESLGIRKAFVVGHSGGGRLAQQIALCCKEQTNGLVLLASGLDGVADSEPIRAQHAGLDKAMHNGRADLAVQIVMRLWVDGSNGLAPDPVRRKAQEMLSSNFQKILARPAFGTPRPEGLKQSPAAASDGLPFARRLSSISVPTLVLAGGCDQDDILHVAKLFEKYIPDVKLKIIPGAGHLANMEQPEIFNRILLKFINGVSEQEND